MKLKTLTLTAAALAAALISTNVHAESWIKKGMKEFTVKLDDRTCTIGRNQTKGNKIHPKYETTHRGKPQPIQLDPKIETLGELEFINWMMKAEKDDSIMIVDTRTEGWHSDLRIPCTINVPYTQLNDDKDLAMIAVMDEFGAEEKDDGTLDFTNAKTIVGYCNGYWCGQTPGMFINAKYSLKNLGYPLEKLKYYRGGMQAWTSLGMSVEGTEAQ